MPSVDGAWMIFKNEYLILIGNKISANALQSEVICHIFLRSNLESLYCWKEILLISSRLSSNISPISCVPTRKRCGGG